MKIQNPKHRKLQSFEYVGPKRNLTSYRSTANYAITKHFSKGRSIVSSQFQSASIAMPLTEPGKFYQTNTFQPLISQLDRKSIY